MSHQRSAIHDMKDFRQYELFDEHQFNEAIQSQNF
jgi:hypothetical protein